VNLQKLFVSPDNKISIKCPHCWHSRVINIANLLVHQKLLRIKCQCESIFKVELEFRKKKRKNTNLDGYFYNPTQEKIPDLSQETHIRAVNCTIRNLSMNGIGFVTLKRHNINKDDKLVVTFILDTATRFLIKKNVLVRVVNGNYIGCEFLEEEQNDPNLGFYVL